MGRNIVETIVGALVLLVAGVFVFYAFTKSDRGAPAGYEVVARFDRIDGLKRGADVTVSGVKVGAVRWAGAPSAGPLPEMGRIGGAVLEAASAVACDAMEATPELASWAARGNSKEATATRHNVASEKGRRVGDIATSERVGTIARG